MRGDRTWGLTYAAGEEGGAEGGPLAILLTGDGQGIVEVRKGVVGRTGVVDLKEGRNRGNK